MGVPLRFHLLTSKAQHQQHHSISSNVRETCRHPSETFDHFLHGEISWPPRCLRGARGGHEMRNERKNRVVKSRQPDAAEVAHAALSDEQ
ncbi:hypothetical protein CgunFtcFv8_005788 [Champsocephalus gunnari]|uniref:Uncharacterized protein n=1 Tax=Champsocephalus gunnari TaxID=52237 RepID=A0AAN8HDV2_CHAGU|nr:hypothetical protein CgunFtcFv8_005788 [Champsocephalus gunnari]